MSANQAATLKIKNNLDTYTPLYPTLPKDQVIGWDAGEIIGPYILELKATDWVRNKQTIALDGVSDQDVLECVKILEGTKAQMVAQNTAYGQLTQIESLNNQVSFTCSKAPDVDFKVQVWWTK